MRYGEMMAELARREAELKAEIDRIRTVRAALGPLVEAVGETGRAQLELEVPQKLVATATSTGSSPVRMTTMQMRSAPLTMVAAARDVLLKAGRPLHIRDIITGVQGMGLATGKSFAVVRANLTPTLIRRRDLFTKSETEKAVFGLAEWSDVAKTG